jgi:NADH:ubiquinone oxidoreductase subunit 4 (subunit M)
LGNTNQEGEMNDLNFREKIVSACMVIAIVGLGLFPQPVFNTAKPALLKTLDKQREMNIPDRGISKMRAVEKNFFFYDIFKMFTR